MTLIGPERLLKDLEKINEYGGVLYAFEINEEPELFRLDGWHGTSSEGLDLNYKIRKALLEALADDGRITLSSPSKDDPRAVDAVYEVKITDKGWQFLEEVRKNK